MANKEYIERLQQVIFHLHHANPIWVKSVPVHEVFQGQTVWQGEVEVFDLTGHPKAKRCYGWTHGDPEEFITILELPPVDSAESAVKVGVSYQIKKARKAGMKAQAQNPGPDFKLRHYQRHKGETE